MELSTLARRVLESADLDLKLAPPDEPLTDDDPGPPRRVPGPARPPGLEIRPSTEVKVPSLEGMPDPAQRVRILHALANHELQAAELFAWALLAFPDAPAAFRAGLAHILQDEQRHTRMYRARVEATGGCFGDYPVNGYFWGKVPDIHTPLQFVCAMSLTFENANLDHTVDYGEAAREAGDEKTALVIERVHEDEAEHVAFGWRWLREFKGEDESMWDAYRASLAWPLRPIKARGKTFHRAGRERAGLDPEFIDRLAGSLAAGAGEPPDRR